MIEPSISELLEKADSRYTLVVVTAKRARQLAEGASKLTECNSEKPVTVAIHELYEGKVNFVRTKSGIK